MNKPNQAIYLIIYLFKTKYIRKSEDEVFAIYLFYELVYFPSVRYALLWFKQGEGRFSQEKLGSGEAERATAFGESNSPQFIRLPRELYGLREKRQAKHLLKSTVMSK